MISNKIKSAIPKSFYNELKYLVIFLIIFLALPIQVEADGQEATSQTIPNQTEILSKEKIVDPEVSSHEMPDQAGISNQSKEEFTYKWENRPDPFMPFLTEETVKAESKVVEEELTGMQKFEPGQLNLVAIVVANGEHIAMVQDSIGKGYIIRKGTKIGRSGVVDTITDNEVIIKEAYLAPFTNKLMHKNIQMVLRKDGDKKQ